MDLAHRRLTTNLPASFRGSTLKCRKATRGLLGSRAAFASTRPGVGRRVRTMADPSASPDSRQNGGATLARQSARVARLRAEARENPVLQRSLAQVAEWQANRLGATYADLAADARYRDAVAFFRNDL